MVGNMTNIPPVPCMGTPTHYGICTDKCNNTYSTNTKQHNTANRQRIIVTNDIMQHANNDTVRKTKVN